MVCVFLFLVTMAIVTKMSQAEFECGGSIDKGYVRRKHLLIRIPDSKMCNWTITVPDNYVMSVSIQRYIDRNVSDPTSLGRHSFMVYDVLHSGQKILIKRMSGQDLPHHFTSSNSIFIDYRSFNKSFVSVLFHIDWTGVVLPSIRDCPKGEEVKDGYIKNGTTATCKCYLPSIDNFFGYPVWLDGTGSLDKHQTYEPTSLTLRYNPDDPNPSYTCTVAYGHYTDTYGPNDVTHIIHYDSKEKFGKSFTTFIVDCEVLFNDSNPAPLVHLEGTSVKSISFVQDYNTSYSYRYTFTVRFKAQAFISLKCVAWNSLFPKLSVSKTVNITSGTPRMQFYKQNEIIKEFTSSFGSDMKIEIPILAYPIPFNYTLTKVGNISSPYPEIDLIRVELSQATDYNVTFTVREWPLGTVVVWMLNLTEEDIGQFVLKIDNGIGDGLDYRFNVNVKSESFAEKDLERNVMNTMKGVGISVACCLILGVVMFILGMKFGKRRNEASKAVAMFQPLTEFEDNSSGSLLLEPSVDLDINPFQGSKQTLQSRNYHERPGPFRHENGSNCFSGVMETLLNLFKRRTGDVALSPTHGSSIIGVDLGSNGGERHGVNETTEPFPSNNHTVDYLEVIDPPPNMNKQKTGRTILPKPPNNNERSVSPISGSSSADVDNGRFQVNETTVSDKHYNRCLEADKLIRNAKSQDKLLSQSAADRDNKRVHLPQETNSGTSSHQSPKISPRKRYKRVPHYEKAEPVQIIYNNDEYTGYVSADDDYITVLPEPQASGYKL